MNLNHYANQPFPFALHGDDAITFSVLSRILNGPCSEIYTDGERVMICLSARPYPVWVWCRDESDAESVAAVADCLREHFPPAEGYRYNLSYGMLERLRDMDAELARLHIQTNLLSYRLDALLPADHPCDGRMEAATMDREEELAGHFQAAIREMEHMERPLEDCRGVVREKIESGRQFIWLDGEGELAALTAYNVVGAYGYVSGVYTLPARRRQGYAMNLVHDVTAHVLEEGLTPILYTDADYGASNACYQKIGYRQVGSLCTVAEHKDRTFS